MKWASCHVALLSLVPKTSAMFATAQDALQQIPTDLNHTGAMIANWDHAPDGAIRILCMASNSVEIPQSELSNTDYMCLFYTAERECAMHLLPGSPDPGCDGDHMVSDTHSTYTSIGKDDLPS